MENVTEKNELAQLSYSPKDSIIVTNDGIYHIELMPELSTSKEADFKENIAYIEGDYFYFYRGKSDPSVSIKKPGIYFNKGTNNSPDVFFLVPPISDFEKEYYNVKSNIAIQNTVSIIDTANSKEALLVAIPESARIFQPEITEQDDILKLAAKKALIVKKVDLDRYKDRFPNKNTLFNLKQVFRGNSPLSMKIFNRFIDALNMTYDIILKDKNPNDVIGEKLDDPIVVSSEETYEV